MRHSEMCLFYSLILVPFVVVIPKLLTYKLDKIKSNTAISKAKPQNKSIIPDVTVEYIY